VCGKRPLALGLCRGRFAPAGGRYPIPLRKCADRGPAYQIVPFHSQRKVLLSLSHLFFFGMSISFVCPLMFRRIPNMRESFQAERPAPSQSSLDTYLRWRVPRPGLLLRLLFFHDLSLFSGELVRRDGNRVGRTPVADGEHLAGSSRTLRTLRFNAAFSGDSPFIHLFSAAEAHSSVVFFLSHIPCE